MRKTVTPTLIGSALFAALGLGQAAQADSDGTLFSAVDLDRGYTLAAAEGKCGEGKCGNTGDGDKGGEGSCGADKGGEGSCGADKGGEGKCGSA